MECEVTVILIIVGATGTAPRYFQMYTEHIPSKNWRMQLRKLAILEAEHIWLKITMLFSSYHAHTHIYLHIYTHTRKIIRDELQGQDLT
jgi:hypothetical protein